MCRTSLQSLIIRNLAKRAMRLLCDSAVVVCWSCGVKKITEAHKVSVGVMKTIGTHYLLFTYLCSSLISAGCAV